MCPQGGANSGDLDMLLNPCSVCTHLPDVPAANFRSPFTSLVVDTVPGCICVKVTLFNRHLVTYSATHFERAAPKATKGTLRVIVSIHTLWGSQTDFKVLCQPCGAKFPWGSHLA